MTEFKCTSGEFIDFSVMLQCVQQGVVYSDLQTTRPGSGVSQVALGVAVRGQTDSSLGPHTLHVFISFLSSHLIEIRDFLRVFTQDILGHVVV